MNAGDIMQAIYGRYERGKYVVIPEAPQCNTGGRRCDAIAVGVWQSTKNEVVGHEFKVSRSDWQSELDKPEKSEAFSVHCNRWYIVTPPKLISPAELKASWGLMEVVGGKIKIRKQAERQEAKPLHTNMLASWLRAATENGIRHLQQKIRLEQQRMHERELLSMKQAVDRERERARQAIEEFEKASGIKIDKWESGRIGEAVKLVMANQGLIRRLKSTMQNARSISNELAERLEALDRELAESETVGA